MFTTSRYASEKSRKLAHRLAKEKKELFICRGKHTIAALVEIARKKGEKKISIVEEEKGTPKKIAVISVSELGNWEWSGEDEL
ncbi:MAG: hypothetical protein ABH983_06245 [Candidatus Micrarchaeota archaeon]|nr:hypothetical protein [Candidatus Micrarchaeota archaeon]MBU1682178.1 hypothetical protein [Candidatus Micrarchaeota archaeon]